jgi:para-nitrobenzyl esterase
MRQGWAVRVMRLAAVLLGWAVATATHAAVSTDKGPVEGQVSDGVAAYLGIPFAAPPVGPLRFRPPQPHAAWSQALAAKQLAPPCIQGSVPPIVQGPIPPSEDCLTLNVWSPVGQGARLPVMVWLYGGGFRGGTASAPYFDGAAIARKARAVVVTLNYRLGALGFLALPALDKQDPQHVSGNLGIRDQQAALRWVKRNIAAFGGEKRQVAVFGESAGAISIEYHLISPASRGLFARAIIESSVAGAAAPTLAEGEAAGARLATELGCTGDDGLACLRAKPAGSFATATTPSGPVVDGVIIPVLPLTALRAGHFLRVPVLIGSNHDEFTVYVWRVQAALGHPMTADDYAAQLRKTYGARADAVLAAYPVSAWPSPLQAYAATQTDSLVACPTDAARRALARDVRVYGYEFTEPDPVPGPLLGPPTEGLQYGDYHTSEVAYVFGLDLQGKKLTGKDATLSDRMIADWGRFAAAGTPGLGWPSDRTGAQVLMLSNQPKINADFAKRHQCEFWQK